ncbi:unnamed protein product, partial [Musa acuminata var. zebrina]
ESVCTPRGCSTFSSTRGAQQTCQIEVLFAGTHWILKLPTQDEFPWWFQRAVSWWGDKSR